MVKNRSFAKRFFASAVATTMLFSNVATVSAEEPGVVTEATEAAQDSAGEAGTEATEAAQDSAGEAGSEATEAAQDSAGESTTEESTEAESGTETTETTEATETEASQEAEPEQTEPEQTESEQTESEQTEPEQTASENPEPVELDLEDDSLVYDSSKYDYTVIKDSTGNTIDLGGMEIVIRDWWSTDWDIDQERMQEEDNEKYQYLKWIQETYNFTIKRAAISDWGSTPSDFVEYVTEYDANGKNKGENYVFVLRNDTVVSNAFNNGLMYDLSTLDCLNFTDDKFQTNKVHELYSKGGGIYAMNTDAAGLGTGIYFNIDLLRKCGINTDTIYNMQNNQTWTWSAWTNMMDTVQNEGYGGFDCNYSVLASAAVFSNGSCYVSRDASGYHSRFDSNDTMEAIYWTQDIIDHYAYNRPEESSWDYYREAFVNGYCAFMVEDAWAASPGCFLYHSVSDEGSSGPEFNIGFVAFPSQKEGTGYTNIWSNNPYVIPSCYSAEQAWNIAFAYNLYTDIMTIPLDDVIKDYSRYNIDNRAKTETVPLLVTNGQVDYSDLFELQIGPDYLWNFCKGASVDNITKNFNIFKAIVENVPIEGTFGVNNGLTWSLDYSTGVMTISGSDVPDKGLKDLTSSTLIYEVRFDKCTLKTSINSLFKDCSRLKAIDFSGVTFSNVSDVSYAFSGCSMLESIDLSGLTLSGNVSTTDMLYRCYSLDKITFGDMSKSNIGNTDISLAGLYVDGASELYTYANKSHSNKTLWMVQIKNHGMEMDICEDASLNTRLYCTVPTALLKSAYAKDYYIEYPTGESSTATVSITNAATNTTYGDYTILCIDEISIYANKLAATQILTLCCENSGDPYWVNQLYYYAAEYLELLISREPQYAQIAGALLNYGAATDKYFSNINYSEISNYIPYGVKKAAALTAEELEPYKMASNSGWSFDNGNIKYLGTSLILNDGISIKHYFDSSWRLSYYILDGKTSYSNQEKTVTIGNIPLWDVSQPYYLTISKDSNFKDCKTLEFSVGNYIYLAYQRSDSEGLLEVLNSLYRLSEEIGKLRV